MGTVLSLFGLQAEKRMSSYGPGHRYMEKVVFGLDLAKRVRFIQIGLKQKGFQVPEDNQDRLPLLGIRILLKRR